MQKKRKETKRRPTRCAEVEKKTRTRKQIVPTSEHDANPLGYRQPVRSHLLGHKMAPCSADKLSGLVCPLMPLFIYLFPLFTFAEM